MRGGKLSCLLRYRAPPRVWAPVPLSLENVGHVARAAMPVTWPAEAGVRNFVAARSLAARHPDVTLARRDRFGINTCRPGELCPVGEKRLPRSPVDIRVGNPTPLTLCRKGLWGKASALRPSFRSDRSWHFCTVESPRIHRKPRRPEGWRRGGSPGPTGLIRKVSGIVVGNPPSGFQCAVQQISGLFP